MEDDNGRPSHAVDETPEEIWYVGESWASHRSKRGLVTSESEQIRDVQGPYEQPTTLSHFASGLREAQERSVAESGWVEPASWSVYKEV